GNTDGRNGRVSLAAGVSPSGPTSNPARVCLRSVSLTGELTARSRVPSATNQTPIDAKNLASRVFVPALEEAKIGAQIEGVAPHKVSCALELARTSASFVPYQPSLVKVAEVRRVAGFLGQPRRRAEVGEQAMTRMVGYGLVAFW